MEGEAESDLQKIEADVAELAARRVAPLLRKPEDLEKVEQHRRMVMRRKAGVEARLKTSIQTQLEDVKTGLSKLKSAVQEIREIRDSMADVDKQCSVCHQLTRDIDKIKDVSRQHNQLSAACDNLKHIVRVPETVVETEELINSGELLKAHKLLTDLEATRDDLLFQLHKTTSEKITEKHPVNAYFVQVASVSDMLATQLLFVMQRALNVVRSDPTKLVTALRIIEREEKSDTKALAKEKAVGFLPPGRPKEWKRKCLDALEKATTQRFESQQPLDSGENKIWLAVYLELVKRTVIEDIDIVKTLFVPCFPPQYNIVDHYIVMYHHCLRTLLEDTASQQREANEIIHLLSWVAHYPEMMRNPKVNVDISRFDEPLLSSSAIAELEKDYTDKTRQALRGYAHRMIEADIQDWSRTQCPDADVNGHYHTAVAVLLFQMLDQNLSVVDTVGTKLKMQVLQVCMDVLDMFCEKYKAAVDEFKIKYWQTERKEPRYFVEYMMAIANNCQFCTDFTQQMKVRVLNGDVGVEEEKRVEQHFDETAIAFQEISQMSCDYLLDMVYTDLEPHLDQLFNKKWLQSGGALSTVDVTMQDYGADFKHLKENFYNYLIQRAQDRLLVKYITAMLEKKTQFKSKDERKKAAEKIKKEAMHIGSIFQKLSEAAVPSTCTVLETLADVIEIKDISLLSLELEGLVNKHPDMREEHAMALLSVRGDVSKSQAKEIIAQTKLANADSDREEGEYRDVQRGYFSEIHIASGGLFN
ncbi:exocyst complex component 3-like [Corticium candelabrum]|uniref:exocyst complex component 3-like n=1 Tax=Corticium candelabrum TaxID=121492 RepID=UPI002E25F910|nr:exocyst complex component 3-like [Corticium candelabrum]